MTKRKLPALHPAWEIAAGVALLLVACFLFYLAGSGLLTGEIIRMSRYHRGVVVMKTHAYQYWVSVVYMASLAGVFCWASIGLLRNAFRKTIRRKD